jgi:CheY-like chemotaxis protein
MFRRRQTIDLLIDIVMPGIDGKELIKQYRTNRM